MKNVRIRIRDKTYRIRVIGKGSTGTVLPGTFYRCFIKKINAPRERIFGQTEEKTTGTGIQY
jgi:hypothetical protein